MVVPQTPPSPSLLGSIGRQDSKYKLSVLPLPSPRPTSQDPVLLLPLHETTYDVAPCEPDLRKYSSYTKHAMRDALAELTAELEREFLGHVNGEHHQERYKGKWDDYSPARLRRLTAFRVEERIELEAIRRGREELCKGKTASQDDCPLFTLPPEIRANIYEYALSDFEDKDAEPFPVDAAYYRPGYTHPRRLDIRLLKTCRAIYREAWAFPVTRKKYTFWLGHGDRRDIKDWQSVNVQLARILRICYTIHKDKLKFKHLQVFSQMFRLETHGLAELMVIPFFSVRSITLTIRHTDWWHWEEDAPLSFQAKWMAVLNKTLPDALEEMAIQLETVERKKEQVFWLIREMRHTWYFRTKGGKTLFADTSRQGLEQGGWKGPNMLLGQRWERDEVDGKIPYFSLTQMFRPLLELEKHGVILEEFVKELADTSHCSEDEQGLSFPMNKSTRLLMGKRWAGDKMEIVGSE